MKYLILFIASFTVHAHTLHYYPNGPLEIIKIGHPTLTMVAKEIPLADIQTSDMQNLIEDMIQTMEKAGGVGLAAPQVNVSKRLFVIKPSFLKKAEALINPKIEYLNAAGMKDSTEGCLSIPGKQYTVKRYKKININYYNRYGEYQTEQAKGFRAIVMQHEYDHLNGLLIANHLFPIEVEWVEGTPLL